MSTNVICGGLNSAPVVAYFHTSRWGDQFLRFTPLDQATQVAKEQEVEHLKEEVKKELLAIKDKPLEQLDFVDALERLGLAYHFEEEIEEAIQQVNEHYRDLCDKHDLYHVSTCFRVLRQHGFYVSCDVFEKFKDETTGDFKSCVLNDVRGMLSLYEASHARIHGDSILDEANAFTTTHLKSLVVVGDNDNNKLMSSPLAEQVAHALHQPLHKGFVRLESKHYITFYEQDSSHNQNLLKLAKLDFNLLLLQHKKELQDLSRWWKDMYSKAPFARDRLVEGYFWIIGCYYEPKYSGARIMFMKIFMILQVFDDIFDAYGNYEILKLLVEGVNKWDYDYVAQLPEYFNSVFQVLLETVDEVEKKLAEDGMSYAVDHFKMQMKITCQTWLQEAQWLTQRYTPKFDEYIEVTRVSIAYNVGLVASFLGMGPVASKESFEWLFQEPMPKIVKSSFNILRLMNDIAGTKFEQNSREHVVSCIHCYMKENDIFDEEHVYRVLEGYVEDEWKIFNEEMLQPYKIPRPLLDRLLHLNRAADVFYKGRTDAYTNVNEILQEKIATALLHPISI